MKIRYLRLIPEARFTLPNILQDQLRQPIPHFPRMFLDSSTSSLSYQQHTIMETGDRDRHGVNGSTARYGMVYLIQDVAPMEITSQSDLLARLNP